MQLFLAIDLPNEAKKQLDSQIAPLKKEYPQYKWVSWENYHITLQFFGEYEDSKTLEKKIQDAIYDQKGFYLYGLYADLSIKDEILIYLTFRREKKIEELVGKIQTGIQLHDQKKFVPHTSLARCRIPSKQQYFLLKKKVERLPIDISFYVGEIVLFESVPTGKRPRYRVIKRFPLL